MIRPRSLWLLLRRAAIPAFAVLLTAGPVAAADMPAGWHGKARTAEYGEGYGVCPIWRPAYGLFVPTNHPCDPTYVGSAFGLNQASEFGDLPPPGYDAP